MSSHHLEVVLVPVTARFGAPLDSSQEWLEPAWGSRRGGPDKPSLLAYAIEGGWLATPVAEQSLPDVLDRLMEMLALELFPDVELVDHSLRQLGLGSPEPVHFLESSGDSPSLRLIYTVACPVSATERRPTGGGRWLDLHGAPRNVPEPLIVRDFVRSHWRHALEESTAALSLLPRYFTMTQLLQVYEAVWDTQLDWGNFSAWVTKRDNRGLFVKEVDSETVRRERDALLNKVGGPSAVALSGATVGSSLLALAVPLSVLAAPVGTALGAAAGAVAYQRARRGRSPQWYTGASVKHPTRLRETFSPRPRG